MNPRAEYGLAERWPRASFVAAAIELQKRTNCCWLIFSGNADTKLASQIAAEITPHAAAQPRR